MAEFDGVAPCCRAQVGRTRSGRVAAVVPA